jgi:fatty-acyl-CoA synthase
MDKLLFSNFLAHHAAQFGDKTAIIFNAKHYSYRRLYARTCRAAARLQGEWGLAAQSHVAYLGNNQLDMLTALFALARLNAVLVPLNFRLALPELALTLKHSQASLLLYHPEFAETAQQLGAELGIAIQALAALVATPCPHQTIEASPTPEQVALLVYSSGSTATPKGVLHSHAGLLANMQISAQLHALTAHDSSLACLPLFHVGGLCIQTLPMLWAGGTVILQERFEAVAWFDAVENYRPRHSVVVPAIMRALSQHPRWALADCSSLQGVMAGSSIVPLQLIKVFHAKGIAVGQVYGATETGPVSIALATHVAQQHEGKIGWPVQGVDVKLLPTETDPKVGEILLRGPNLFVAYWPQKNKTDTWFATGDLARVDENGCYEVVGRSIEMLISGGENIYPAEIEHFLLAQAGVLEAAVIGMTDAQWGEVPVAFMVLSPSTSIEKLHAAMQGQLAKFKQPKKIIVLDALPKTALGKVQKNLLHEQIKL